MHSVLYRFQMLLRPSRPIPPEHKANFFHLYMDIAWFGMLSGTTLSFLGVYAARQGASAAQIGLLSAIPAFVSLIFSLPLGTWLGKRSIGKAVFWSAVLQRVFYLVFVFLPVILLPQTQVWVIIVLSFIMTIPATSLTVGFNALFAEVVPVEWRGEVVGKRLAISAIVTTVSSLAAGQILHRVDFPLGYQIVFALGVVGAAFSSLHLVFLRKVGAQPVGNQQSVRQERPESQKLRLEVQQLVRQGWQNLRFDVMGGSFARVMGLLFFWHFAQFLVIPTVTPYTVNILKISDQTIGLALGIFNLTTFLGSLRLGSVTGKWGNKRITGLGIMGVSLFPLLLSIATGPELYLAAHLVGGLAWSMAGGALFNYILDNVPPGDRPAYLGWYSLVMNGAILAGSLIGPAFAAQIGFSMALALYGMLRFLAGAAILKWG
jgi:MFS family permease